MLMTLIEAIVNTSSGFLIAAFSFQPHRLDMYRYVHMCLCYQFHSRWSTCGLSFFWIVYLSLFELFYDPNGLGLVLDVLLRNLID